MINNQKTITPASFNQRDKSSTIRELITRIIKINAKKDNIDVAITSEKSKKTITITESIERNIFRLGQFFKNQGSNQKLQTSNFNTKQWEQLLEIERLQKLGVDVQFSNDSNRQKTYTIVFHE